MAEDGVEVVDNVAPPAEGAQALETDNWTYGLENGFSIADFYLNDEAYDQVLQDMGERFQGDPVRAKFYLDKLIEGIAAPFVRKGKEELLGKIRLGFHTRKEALATATLIDFEDNGRMRTAPCVQVGLHALEDLSFYDADEEYFYYNNEEDVDRDEGPAWYAARELGVEEGAHIAYMMQRGMVEARPKSYKNSAEYHENDVEFDGLNERILDTDRILRERGLPFREVFMIRKVQRRMKRTLQNSHMLRAFRQREPEKIDLSESVKRGRSS